MKFGYIIAAAANGAGIGLHLMDEEWHTAMWAGIALVYMLGQARLWTMLKQAKPLDSMLARASMRVLPKKGVSHYRNKQETQTEDQAENQGEAADRSLGRSLQAQAEQVLDDHDALSKPNACNSF